MQLTRISSGPNPGVPALLEAGDSLADPFSVSLYLRLCEAIGRLTAAWVAADPAAFVVRGADLRYVVERHLYFSLVADRGLYRKFVARERGRLAAAGFLGGLGHGQVPKEVGKEPYHSFGFSER